jgi:hypothetical protein
MLMEDQLQEGPTHIFFISYGERKTLWTLPRQAVTCFAPACPEGSMKQFIAKVTDFLAHFRANQVQCGQ